MTLKQRGRRDKPIVSNAIWIGLGLAVIVIIAVALWPGRAESPQSTAELMRVHAITHQFPANHPHGLAYDGENDRLVIATHYGLFVLVEDQLYQLGESRDDFMGFSLHPHEPQLMYSSGHPRTGGNLGVMRSEDGGLTWEQIFQGLTGERVDFHSMTISPADPERLWGVFQDGLYHTQDGGESWLQAGLPSARGLCWGVPCLAADSKDADTLYAGTPEGLFRSQDSGESWTLVNDEIGMVAGVVVDPHNPQRLLAFTQRYGVALSADGGQTWEARNEGITLAAQDYVFGFAFHPTNEQVLFAATVAGQIYRSRDGGATWERILE